jgi:hypothetical protein
MIAGAWFLAGDQIRAVLNDMGRPMKSGAITSPLIMQQSSTARETHPLPRAMTYEEPRLPIVTQPNSIERQASSQPPAPAYQAPPLPIATYSITVRYEEIERIRSWRYALFPRATIIPPGQWVSVYWPDPIYKNGSSWKYVYFVGGNILVEDCVTKAKVLLRRPTTQEARGPNLSCQPMHVMAANQSYAHFYSLPY